MKRKVKLRHVEHVNEVLINVLVVRDYYYYYYYYYYY
jgi:hypothetical protein